MKYFIIAGEASGDLHASNLMAALKRCDADAQFCFLGGDLMAAQDGEMVRHYRDMAFMGVVNVLLNLRKVLHNLSDCKAAINRFQPDVVILVDYPSFNLRIAKYVKKHTTTPVYYYISPKIWAWKTFRIHSIKRYIDRMYTIFPFETPFYAQFQYPVEYVGNPTVDAIAHFVEHHPVAPDFREKNGLDARPIVAVLAGSRKQEITATLPRVLPLAARYPDFQFVLAAAPSADLALYQPYLSENVRVVRNATYALLQQSFAAVVNSGTATLETAIFRVPQVVVYHVIGGRFASLLKKILIKTKYISLVNLVADKAVVRELVAHEFSLANVATEIDRLLRDADYRRQMQADYDGIAQTLGSAGAAQRAAAKIVESLKTN